MCERKIEGKHAVLVELRQRKWWAAWQDEALGGPSKLCAPREARLSTPDHRSDIRESDDSLEALTIHKEL